MRILMTNFVKKSEVKNAWYLIDGSNAVIGRLATIIAKILRGKHKATFTPHMDTVSYTHLTLPTILLV